MPVLAVQVTGASGILEMGVEVRDVPGKTFVDPTRASLVAIKLKKMKKLRFRVQYRGASESKSPQHCLQVDTE